MKRSGKQSEADQQQTMLFFWRKWQILVVIVALLIAGWFIFTKNLDLPKFDALAERDVLQFYLSMREEQLRQQYPELPLQELRRMLEAEGVAFQKEQGFHEAVEGTAEAYKAYVQDPDGMSYLFHVDPYHYYRQAQNILEYGHVGNKILQTGYRFTYDTVKDAPTGRLVQASLLPYLLVWLYQGMQFLNPGASLMHAALFYPPLVGLLSLLLVFFIAKKMSNTLGGFLAGLFLILHPKFFAFHQAGYADTNALTISLSLLVVFFFLLVLDGITNKQRWKTIFPGVLFLASLWLFSFTWGGYFYILSVLFLFLVLYFILKLCRDFHQQHSRKSLSYLFMVLLLTGFILWRVSQEGLFRRALAYLNLGIGYTEPMLPVFPFVSELGSMDTSTFFQYLGGYGIAFFALLFLSLLLWKNRKLSAQTKYDLFLVVWLLVLFFPATKIRFFPFFLLPLAILMGRGCVLLLTAAKEITSIYFPKLQQKIVGGCIVSLIMLLFLLSLTPSLAREINNAIPIMDDSIYNTSLKIKAESPENITINVWWDSGYFYEAIAEKPVLFDGASFDNMKSYWMARVFTETDEEVAAGILRMLDCNTRIGISGATALEYLAADMGYKRALEELNSLVKENRIAAQSRIQRHNLSIMQRYFDSDSSGGRKEKRNILLNLTHCTPPEGFLIVSEDLLQKYWAFDYYSRLDFVTEPGQIPIRDDLVTPAYNCKILGDTAYCEYGFRVHVKENRAEDSNGEKISFLLYDGKQLVQPEAELRPDKKAMLLFVDQGRLRYVLIRPEHVNTMLVRLLLLGGEGLEHFEKFSDISGRYSKKVVAYRLKWE
ncbi:hypothetical protein HYS48_00870 [Candidatus Woesearchaeota archaeon]|nr:hypothetical protein [Candidatus Woesearchaeota archaeon]